MAKRRRDGEGTIRQKSPNCWEVRVPGAIDFATGEPVRISRYAPTEEEAIHMLRQMQYEVEKKQLQEYHITLGDWLDLWLKTYMQTTLKQSTYNSYASYAKNHFKPALGSIRLDLMTGLRLGKLLGLRWVDIDFRASVLHVDQTLNRLQIPNLPDDYTGPRTEIVIQAPKSESPARAVSLLPQAVKDLISWREIQKADQQANGDLYHDSGFIVTNPLGGFIEPRTFKDYYNQILKLAGLPHMTFHALQHTFATRAVEQGMDEKTLSTILGHASTFFTMDTYTHVLDDHKQEEMKLMEDLFDSIQFSPQVSTYPILVTATPEGYLFTAPDFPEIKVNAHTMEEGLLQVTDRLRTILSTRLFPSSASSLSEIDLSSGQFVVQCKL